MWFPWPDYASLLAWPDGGDSHAKESLCDLFGSYSLKNLLGYRQFLAPKQPFLILKAFLGEQAI
jgi:hypothetical protein